MAFSHIMRYSILLADADGTLFDFHAGERKALTVTMTDLREIRAAVLGYGEAQAQAGTALPVLVSMKLQMLNIIHFSTLKNFLLLIA